MQRVGIGIVGRGSVALGMVAGILFSAVVVVPAKAWNSTDISNALPPLEFTMTRASDDTTVTSANYKGKIILLDFGYTSCPDVCPTTLLNLSTMLKELGQWANDVRVLFVTVDSNRDTLSIMKNILDHLRPKWRVCAGLQANSRLSPSVIV